MTHDLQVATQGTLVHWLRPTQIRAMVAYYESDGTGGNYNGFSAAGPSIREIHSSISFSDYSFVYQGGLENVNVRGGVAQALTWAHVAVTWDTAGDLVLYVDGSEVDRKDLSLTTFSWIM